MSLSHRRHIAGSTLALTASAALLLHRPPGSASAAPAPLPATVSYAAGAARWLNAPHTVEMTQGVTFTQDDAHLQTAAATVTLDNQQRAVNAKSTTPVHMFDPQNDLTGAQGFVDFTHHVATLTGSVVLVIKPAKTASASSLRSQFKDTATVTCDKITYDYRTKLGHVPGPLTIHQKDNVLTADTGEYDAHAQTVTLTGDVHGHNGDGEIHAPVVKMSLKEGSESIFLPGPHITGVFNVPPEDADILPNSPSAAPPTQSPAPKPGPPAPTSSPKP